MNSDSIFALVVVTFPLVVALVVVGLVYGPGWRRKRKLRQLDAKIDASLEWWEVQFDATSE